MCLFNNTPDARFWFAATQLLRQSEAEHSRGECQGTRVDASYKQRGIHKDVAAVSHEQVHSS